MKGDTKSLDYGSCRDRIWKLLSRIQGFSVEVLGMSNGKDMENEMEDGVIEGFVGFGL